MKVTITLDIPAADYAIITTWLNFYNPGQTIEKALEHGDQETLIKFLSCARKHMKTGKAAYERFQDKIAKEKKNE